MADIYCSTIATGENDGSSWDDAYTSLSTAIAALSANDTLYLNAPEDTPFTGGGYVIADNNVNIITDQGPSRVTWFDYRTFSTSWVDAGGGVFSLTLATEPSHVVYDFKRDDLAGTVTGVNLSDTGNQRKLNAIKHTGFDPEDCRTWYGFLRDGGATSTPAEGQWGYTDGTLYVHPKGSPTLANINALCGYISAATGDFNALRVTSDDVSITGNMWTKLYLNPSSNGGYSVKGDGAERLSVQGVRAIGSGWHTVGSAGAVTAGGGRITDCLSLLWSSSSVPWVFYTPNNIADYDGIGERLLHVDTGLLDQDGVPLGNTPSGNAHLSHSTGMNTIGNITWRRCSVVCYQQEINTKHSTSYQSQVRFVAMDSSPSYTWTDFSTITNRIEDSIIIGSPTPLTDAVGGLYSNCQILSDSSEGDIDADIIDGPTTEVLLDRCVVERGDCRRFIGSMNVSTERIRAVNTTFIATDSTYGSQRAWFGPSGSISGIIRLESCIFDKLGSGELAIATADATQWNANFPSIVSDGSNIIDSGYLPLDHGNPGVGSRDSAWWIANISGGSTDTFVADVDLENPEAAHTFGVPVIDGNGSYRVFGCNSVPYQTKSLGDEFTVMIATIAQSQPARKERIIWRQGDFYVAQQTDDTIRVVDGSTEHIAGSQTIKTDRWSVVSVKQDASGNLALFIDNQADGTKASASVSMGDSYLMLGGPGVGFSGNLALIGSFGAALSDGEVLRRASSAKTVSIPGTGIAI